MLDPIITILVLIAVGLGAGTLGSMIGVGGGIIMVPALTFLGAIMSVRAEEDVRGQALGRVYPRDGAKLSRRARAGFTEVVLN